MSLLWAPGKRVQPAEGRCMVIFLVAKIIFDRSQHLICLCQCYFSYGRCLPNLKRKKIFIKKKKKFEWVTLSSILFLGRISTSVMEMSKGFLLFSFGFFFLFSCPSALSKWLFRSFVFRQDRVSMGQKSSDFCVISVWSTWVMRRDLIRCDMQWGNGRIGQRNSIQLFVQSNLIETIESVSMVKSEPTNAISFQRELWDFHW